jgi:hypothetical protein
VSQFAAGCAICGADLVAARAARERRREAMPSLSAPAWFPQVTGTDLVVGGLLLVAALAAPLIGGPIAGLFAYFANQRGDLVQRNFALAAVAAALIVVILISFLPGSWSLLLPWVNLSGPLPTN